MKKLTGWIIRYTPAVIIIFGTRTNTSSRIAELVLFVHTLFTNDNISNSTMHFAHHDYTITIQIGFIFCNEGLSYTIWDIA